MKEILFLLTVLTCCAASAQDNVLVFRLGTGTYNMNTQKKFQKEFLEQSTLPLKAVHEFPPYLSFGGAVGIKITDQSVGGIWCDYSSTGGTLHYADYSGYARMDQLLRSYQYGLFFQTRINKSLQWPLYATSHVSVVSSRASVTSELSIGSDSERDGVWFKSTNYGFRPGLMLQRKVKSLVFQASLGFELQIHSPLESQDDILFTTPSGENVTAQWDGIRAGVGVGVVLGSKVKEAGALRVIGM